MPTSEAHSRRARRHPAGWTRWLALGASSWLACVDPVPAQQPPVPAVQPPDPAAPAATPPAGSREAELEAKLRRYEAMFEKLPDPDHVAQLEETVRQLSGQVDQLSGRLAEAEAQKLQKESGSKGSAGGGSGGGSGGGGGGGSGGGVGQVGPVSSTEMSPDAEMPPPMEPRPLKATIGSGISLATEDDEFTFQSQTVDQWDGRFYGQYDRLHSPEPFAVPLGLVFFNGRLTKPFDSTVGLGNPFGQFAIFYAFLNINFDDLLQFRLGRQKQPFAYEWYEVPLYGLINIERSMFFNNFFPGFTRDGIMALGKQFDDRLEYNVGLFGTRRQIGPQMFDGEGRFFSVAALLDARPFGASGVPALEHLHVGGSVFSGARNGTPETQTFYTMIPTFTNAGFGIPFSSATTSTPPAIRPSSRPTSPTTTSSSPSSARSRAGRPTTTRPASASPGWSTCRSPPGTRRSATS